jgi:uncharacterized protein YndB with AHSA1/START domain
MTERSVRHAKFTIERPIPSRASACSRPSADPRSKAKWFVGPDDWEQVRPHARLSGRRQESVSGGPPAARAHYNCTYQDIVPNERIVTTYEMHLDKTRISVSLATVEFKVAGAGTRLVLTGRAPSSTASTSPNCARKAPRGLLDQLGAAFEKGVV